MYLLCAHVLPLLIVLPVSSLVFVLFTPLLVPVAVA